MADTKVSALTDATAVVAADEFLIVQSGVSKRLTAAELAAYTDTVGLAAHLADAVDAHDATAISYAGNTNLAATTVEAALDELDDEKASLAVAKTEHLGIAVGDETTAITTGTAKVTFRMPYAMTLTAVRASLTTASSSGTPTIDINEGGTTILSTKLTIDANEKTSTTAAVAAVISDSSLADDAEMTIDIDTAGTGAAGLKVWLIGTRA